MQKRLSYTIVFIITFLLAAALVGVVQAGPPGRRDRGPDVEKRVVTQVPLEWPTVEGSPVSSEVVHFVRAWVLEFCLLDREDPAQAALLRERFGFPPNANMFNCSQIFPGAGFTD